MACCSFAEFFSEDVAIATPHLFLKDGSLAGTYVMDMRDFDSHQDAIINAMDECRKRDQFPSIIRPEYPEIFFTLPDFSSLDFRLEPPPVAEMFTSVHKGSL